MFLRSRNKKMWMWPHEGGLCFMCERVKLKCRLKYENYGGYYDGYINTESVAFLQYIK